MPKHSAAFGPTRRLAVPVPVLVLVVFAHCSLVSRPCEATGGAGWLLARKASLVEVPPATGKLLTWFGDLACRTPPLPFDFALILVAEPDAGISASYGIQLLVTDRY